MGGYDLLPPFCTLLVCVMVIAPVCSAMAAEEYRSKPEKEKIWVYHLAPEPRGGRAYKLVYAVPVPVDTYWGFKTDFDNDFLTQNKYILEHHFISRSGNAVVTLNKYSHHADASYLWQTTVSADAHRLDYVLINPEEAEHKFHYGYIQIEAIREGTLVTQVAYFDFWGVSIWAAYPWAGGMKDFLFYTARWEQKKVQELKDRYSNAD